MTTRIGATTQLLRITAKSGQAIIGQLEGLISRQMMGRKKTERKFLFALLQQAFKMVGYNNFRVYFHDEIDKERTKPMNRAPAPSDTVLDFAKGSTDINITNNGLLLKISASEDETFIVSVDQQTGAVAARPAIEKVASYLQKRFSLEFQRMLETKEHKKDAFRLRAILQLGEEIDRKLARSARSEPTNSIIGPTMRTIGEIFPRLRSASIALWDEEANSLVNAASLGVQWATFIDSTTPFGFAGGLLRDRRTSFVHAPKVRVDDLDAGRSWCGGDSFVLPIYTDKFRKKSLGVVSISTEAGRYLNKKQLEALEHLVAILRSKLTLNRVIAELAWASRHDGATAMLNKKTGAEILRSRFTAAKSTDRALSMVMIDLDHFKKVNDTFGHPVGDMVLVQLSRLMRRHAASYPQFNCEIVRDGGEEFYIVLSEATAEQARSFAEELREKIAAFPFEISGGRIIHKQASMGVVDTTNYAEALAMKHASDAALYHAKETGRNRVVVATLGMIAAFDETHKAE